MNKPKTVYAVVCESGDIAADGGGLKVFDCAVDAHEDVEAERHSGMHCRCKEHRVVPYVPKVPSKKGLK